RRQGLISPAASSKTASAGVFDVATRDRDRPRSDCKFAKAHACAAKPPAQRLPTLMRSQMPAYRSGTVAITGEYLCLKEQSGSVGWPLSWPAADRRAAPEKPRSSANSAPRARRAPKRAPPRRTPMEVLEMARAE